jgi:serine/threonine-protein kinase
VSTPQERLATALAGRYRLDRELGHGGMATVYLAQDLKHQRPVALKVLRPDLSALLGAERFHQEIRTAAGLQHPHILPLYDSGEADGLLYYTMPFVEGQSLRDRLTSEGRLPVDETIRIGLEVARALGHAHQRGIIHRDIKPENILIGGGYALVADFGIAKALSPEPGGDRLTEPGLVIGTPAYMSPEQSSAEPDLDGRSDLYSLSTVLYEMLAGEVPYPGNNPHTIIAKRFTDPVPSVGRLRPGVPRHVDLAIMKALALEPVDRFATAGEFCAALSAPEEGRPTLGVILPSGSAEAKPAPDASIAVLPFANTSSDPENEYFSAGIAEELLEALARVPGLKVAARTSSFAFKGRSVDLRSVARQLGVRTLLEGSVRRSGDRVRITAQLVDARDGCYIWSERYDRGMQEIFALQDEIARAIVTAVEPALRLRTSPEPPPPPTADQEAYELFLKGRFYVQHVHKSLPLAVKYLEEAIQRDPGFALAHAHLARAYMFAGTHHVIAPDKAFPRSRVAALRALELDDSQAAIHATLGILSLMHDWDWKAAAAHLGRAAQLTVGHQLPSFGHCLLAATEGRIDEALTLSRRIIDLDPASQKAHQEHVVLLSLARRFPEVLEHTRMILELSPGSSEVFRWIGQAYEHLERWPEALQAHRTAVTMSRRNAWSMMGLARALFRMNLADEGNECLTELTAGVSSGRTPCIAVATVHAGVGQADTAFEWLTRSIEAREPWLVFLNVDPIFDGIRPDPRFGKLVHRIGIPTDRGASH